MDPIYVVPPIARYMVTFMMGAFALFAIMTICRVLRWRFK